MHFLRTGFLEHADDPVTCRSTHDGIVNHDHAFSLNCILQDIQFHAHTGFPLALLRLDKGSSDIAIFYKCGSIWNTGFERITKCSCISGFRYANDQICLNRAVLGKTSSCNDTGLIHTHTIDHAVRSCEINVFKYASAMFLLAHVLMAFNPLLRRYNNHLSRLHIPDKLCSDRIKCAAFRCKHVCIVAFSDAEWTEPKRITGTDQFSRTHDNQGIGTDQLLHGILNCFLCRRCLYTFPGNMICDHLGVDRRLEDCTIMCELSSKLRCIDKIPVMCQSKGTLDIIQYKRLCILSGTRTGCRISYMSNTDIAFELI